MTAVLPTRSRRSRRARQPAPDGPPWTLTDIINLGTPQRQAKLRARVSTLFEVLGVSPADPGDESLTSAIDGLLAEGEAPAAWLALAVLTANLPLSTEVHALVRAGRLGDGTRFLAKMLEEYGQFAEDLANVEVIQGQVLVDVHHTARNLFATGIQRVSREAARRWSRDHEVTLIGWTRGYAAYRRLGAAEIDVIEGRASSAPRAVGRDGAPRDGSPDVIVPWRCTHIVPELPAELERAPRYQAFVSFSRCRTGLVGYDCVPLMAAETCAEGMSLGFARYLGAAARVDRIATDSRTAAVEYRGWRHMLTGAGLPGPQIEPIPIAVESRPSTEQELAAARQLICLGTLPVILIVGSHEPRKNHLPVLHASEVLWREGLKFTLTFVGGNSWNSERFNRYVEELQARDRPVQVIRALAEDLLWAAYRVAHCTVFPSIHEGFGLPVAESLACGTPVITSDYGAMRECAAGGGALLVDPRDDGQMVEALRRILVDGSLRDRLASEAAKTPVRSWDDYAAEAWDYFVGAADNP